MATAIAAVLLGGGVVGGSLASGENQATPRASDSPTTTSTARGDVTALCRLRPKGDITTVGTPFGAGDARIEKLLVAEGDRVVEGQLLHCFDEQQLGQIGNHGRGPSRMAPRSDEVERDHVTRGDLEWRAILRRNLAVDAPGCGSPDPKLIELTTAAPPWPVPMPTATNSGAIDGRTKTPAILAATEAFVSIVSKSQRQRP